ncbi:hypothetical protein EB118_20435 [bacterium]|nr:hypothetical protein [bacterium]
MPIIAGNIVVAEKPTTKTVVELKDGVKEVVQVSEVKQYTDGHTLIVNGKPKKIGKKSHYLLDMLTLDD